jgi:hypothetical protein
VLYCVLLGVFVGQYIENMSFVFIEKDKIIKSMEFFGK